MIPNDDLSFQMFSSQSGARITADFAARGLGFDHHNHDFEMSPLPDGCYPIEHLLGGGDELEGPVGCQRKRGGAVDGGEA